MLRIAISSTATPRSRGFPARCLAMTTAAPSAACCLIEFPDRAAAKAYIEVDPYTQAGIFQDISIERWRPGLEVRQRDYQRKDDTMQFVVHSHNKANSSERLAALRDAHFEYLHNFQNIVVARGALLDDAATHTIGSLLILDVVDKAEAEAFWADEPFTRAGIFDGITIERWRFGHV
ncbi:MAG: hypothetical protein ACI9DC_001746 [Gammaproteobacteria bacterium]